MPPNSVAPPGIDASDIAFAGSLVGRDDLDASHASDGFVLLQGIRDVCAAPPHPRVPALLAAACDPAVQSSAKAGDEAACVRILSALCDAYFTTSTADSAQTQGGQTRTSVSAPVASLLDRTAEEDLLLDDERYTPAEPTFRPLVRWIIHRASEALQNTTATNTIASLALSDEHDAFAAKLAIARSELDDPLRRDLSRATLDILCSTQAYNIVTQELFGDATDAARPPTHEERPVERALTDPLDLEFLETLMKQGYLHFQHSLMGSLRDIISDQTPFYESIHSNVIAALLSASLRHTSVDVVVAHLTNGFASFDPQHMYPYDLEDAMLIWVNQCLLAVKHSRGDAASPTADAVRGDVGDICELDDLAKGLQDGRALCGLFAAYFPAEFGREAGGMFWKDKLTSEHQASNWRAVERLATVCLGVKRLPWLPADLRAIERQRAASTHSSSNSALCTLFISFLVDAFEVAVDNTKHHELCVDDEEDGDTGNGNGDDSQDNPNDLEGTVSSAILIQPHMRALLVEDDEEDEHDSSLDHAAVEAVDATAEPPTPASASARAHGFVESATKAADGNDEDDDDDGDAGADDGPGISDAMLHHESIDQYEDGHDAASPEPLRAAVQPDRDVHRPAAAASGTPLASPVEFRHDAESDSDGGDGGEMEQYAPTKDHHRNGMWVVAHSEAAGAAQAASESDSDISVDREPPPLRPIRKRKPAAPTSTARRAGNPTPKRSGSPGKADAGESVAYPLQDSGDVQQASSSTHDAEKPPPEQPQQRQSKASHHNDDDPDAKEKWNRVQMAKGFASPPSGTKGKVEKKSTVAKLEQIQKQKAERDEARAKAKEECERIREAQRRWAVDAAQHADAAAPNPASFPADAAASPAKAAPKRRAASFVKPQSNRTLITNALMHVCLAGSANATTKQQVMEDLRDSPASHFVILFRDVNNFSFRGLYSWDPVLDQTLKVYAGSLGPNVLDSSSVIEFYKYDSGARTFKTVPTRSFGRSVHAVAIGRDVPVHAAAPAGHTSAASGASAGGAAK
nr:hypothetical protein HK105_008280 [Polyrhizophydium stewartii]